MKFAQYLYSKRRWEGLPIQAAEATAGMPVGEATVEATAKSPQEGLSLGIIWHHVGVSGASGVEG